MRIVIDMQGAQTESRFRGIGRYSMSFIQSLVRNKREHDLHLVLNGLLSDSIDPILDAFSGLLSREHIHIWQAPGPVRDSVGGNECRREVAEIMREAFLARLNPDVVLVTSLFEGYIDEAVTSIGRFAQHIPTAVILYDLIPFLNPELYLKPDPQYAISYSRKIESLKKADLWLAISQSAKREGSKYLALPDDRLVNISTACDSVFKPLELSEKQRDEFLAAMAIRGPFILYSGGADDRKNLPRFIRAYAQLPDDLRCRFLLVFAGKIPDGNKRHLKKIAAESGIAKDRLVFTGYISNEELVKLYNLCRLFVFPSLHEGFGLPALEAMSCGAAVIGSNATSIPEVIENKEALFDPVNVNEMSDKMAQVLDNDAFRSRLIQQGLKTAKKFSWNNTAHVALAALEELYASRPHNVFPRIQANDILDALIPSIAFLLRTGKTSEAEKASIAASIAINHPLPGRRRRLYVDISELVHRDAGTGIQRVTRAILTELLLINGGDFEIQPVYSPPGSHSYRYANRFAAKYFDKKTDSTSDFILEPQQGDVFLGLDLQPQIVAECRDYYHFLRQRGVQVTFVLYDLVPLLLPDVFPIGTKEAYRQWLDVVLENNGVLCISQTVAGQLKKWLKQNLIEPDHPFFVRWFHLGADLENSHSSHGFPDDAEKILESVRAKPTFLMVGTVEPRKGHRQALAAFDLLWQKNEDVNLVIVGKSGWMVDSLSASIEKHPQNGVHLFWLKSVSDEFLAALYQHSRCLLAPSIAEGFGLPLIEAAKVNLPIIARDLPVFKEVAGDGAFYFSTSTAEGLASSMTHWLTLYAQDNVPSSKTVQWLTWSESAQQLLAGVFGKRKPSYQKKNPQPEANAAGNEKGHVLVLSPYPVRKPQHGGQLRTAAIIEKFRCSGFSVQTMGFYQVEAYHADEINHDDIAFPTDSRYRLYQGHCVAPLSDYLMTSFATSDANVFEQVQCSLKSDVDVIIVEQPWFYPFACLLKQKASQCRNALIVFSSQNIESEMKQQILNTSDYAEFTSPAVKEIMELEQEAARKADLTIAVTEDDAKTLRRWGASRVVVAPNGIKPWTADPEKVEYWQSRLPRQPWPLFIASAHPPNYTGFIDALGAALAWIPPGSKLVVAGGVGPHLQKELAHSTWPMLNTQRIQVLGVLDEEDLVAVKSLAHAFLLPIGAGGGSNIKTAEALFSAKPVVCTPMALRGFESYKTLPGVFVAQTPDEFHVMLRSVLTGRVDSQISHSRAQKSLRHQLTWDACLDVLPDEIGRLLDQRKTQ